MADYRSVSTALTEGADPEMMCMTCPWDRFCINPPTMTAGEVETALEKSKREDLELTNKAKAEGKPAGMPVGTLLTVLMNSGKDTQAQICPVLALRLRSSDGAGIVATIRTQMRGEK